MTRCGICNLPQSNTNPLFCPSCVNFETLKPKLQYLGVLKEMNDSKDLVNEVLGRCIRRTVVSDMKNLDGKKKLASKLNNINIESISALSSQLSTIDTMIIKRKNNKIQKEINNMKTRTQVNREKLSDLRNNLQLRRSRFEETKNVDKKRKQFQEIAARINKEKSLKQQDNTNISKQINNSKSLLYQELIGLYIIKKRKISGTNQNVFMMSFLPIISSYNLVEFNFETLNASMERIVRFLYQISQVLLIFDLPYKLEDQNCKVLNFDLSLKKDQQVWELSKFELRLYCNGISRLIEDIYFILKFLELDEEIEEYNQLLRIDELIYKMANNDYKLNNNGKEGDTSSPARVVVKVNRNKSLDIDLLTNKVYDAIVSRINRKNNEWHVVKKEYLVDED